MLGKLLKYEVKATARLFLPLYLTILIFAAINMLFFTVPSVSERVLSFSKIAMGISMTVYITLMIGLLLMTLIVMIQRFYKNLLGDEGYLMFTLPVQSWSHILSKLLVSMFWTFMSGIVAIFSILVISSKDVFIPEVYKELLIAFIKFRQYFGASAYLVSLEAVVLILLALASTILTIYAAIALGHLFRKYKLLASFGMYIVLKTIPQIFLTMFGAIFMNQAVFRLGNNFVPGASDVSNFLLLSILYSGAITAGYFVLTNYILKRKLNLE